jgi:hypothetical protein
MQKRLFVTSNYTIFTRESPVLHGAGSRALTSAAYRSVQNWFAKSPDVENSLKSPLKPVPFSPAEWNNR